MTERRESPLSEVLHILVLGGFALAQPVYDLLARNAGFFVARGSLPVDILVLAIVLSLVAPGLVALVCLSSRLLGARVHALTSGVAVACLVALVVLPALKRIDGLRGTTLIVMAVAAGACVAHARERWGAARQFLTVLTPAILLFPALFLFFSPVKRLVAQSAPVAPRVPGSKAATPVVVVVFDELPLASLLDRDARIDASRYPHFAELAQGATWYRNATAVSDSTLVALPAILSGLQPDPATQVALADQRLATVADYPRNLFTLLGGSHDMSVFEIHSRLCPPSLCGENPGGVPLSDRVRSILSDVGVAWLHIVLPKDHAWRLPPVTGNWSGFSLEKLDGDRVLDGWGGRMKPYHAFLESLAVPRSRPAVHFLHVLLPHAPWNYLPSGRRYSLGNGFADIREDDWVGDERWSDDASLVTRAYARHLLQVGFADTMLGRIVATLRAAGIYDRAVLAVLADHGAAFEPGGMRRRATKENLGGVMPVPMIVKAPGQTEGVVDDRDAQVIDMLPTIADLVGTPMPWRVDGRSLRASVAAPRMKTIMAGGGEAVYSLSAAEAESTMRAALERKVAQFGAGDGGLGLYRAGPHAELVGRVVADFPVDPGTALDVELSERDQFERVRPDSDFIPARITGRLTGRSSTGSPADVAISVNGIVRATARAFPAGEGAMGFSTMVPESSFRRGSNTIGVYVVSGGPGAKRLSRARMPSPWHDTLQRVARTPSGEALLGAGVAPVPVVQGFAGYLDVATEAPGGVELQGWAADFDTMGTAVAVVVAVDGRVVSTAPPDRKRPDIVAEHKAPGFLWSGFAFRAPIPSRGGKTRPEVRVFALTPQRQARELTYSKGYAFGRAEAPEGAPAATATPRKGTDSASRPRERTSP